MNNSTIIQKADLTLADLASDGGQLTVEQSNTFIRKLIAAPTILKSARSVVMTASRREINKIGFGSRILKKAVSATALASGDRSKPTTEQVTLTTKEVIAEVHLPYDVIEDNIERGNINAGGANTDPKPVMGGMKDTIIALMAERAALDLEELALLGDTNSGDAYLALIDGFLLQITSNSYSQAGAVIDRGMFKGGVKAMPDQYLRNRAALRHYVSMDNETEYRDAFASRETAGGDAKAEGFAPIRAFGSEIMPVSLMPAAQGIFTHPKNFIFGIQRDISIEVDKDIRARNFIIVLTAAIDFKIEEEEAAVLYTNIG